ncbi:hypothetical protein ROSI111154_15665 [Rouxiella silvae]
MTDCIVFMIARSKRFNPFFNKKMAEVAPINILDELNKTLNKIRRFTDVSIQYT